MESQPTTQGPKFVVMVCLLSHHLEIIPNAVPEKVSIPLSIFVVKENWCLKQIQKKIVVVDQLYFTRKHRYVALGNHSRCLIDCPSLLVASTKVTITESRYAVTVNRFAKTKRMMTVAVVPKPLILTHNYVVMMFHNQS